MNTAWGEVLVISLQTPTMFISTCSVAKFSSTSPYIVNLILNQIKNKLGLLPSPGIVDRISSWRVTMSMFLLADGIMSLYICKESWNHAVIYIHIVRIGRCERHLELVSEHDMRGCAGCFSPNAHNVYIDMLGRQVLVSEPIHSELRNWIKNE